MLGCTSHQRLFILKYTYKPPAIIFVPPRTNRK